MGELFGLARLQQVLQQPCADHLEFLERLFAAIRSFGCNDSPDDDCTAIVLDFHGF
jgi:serine phosphatase RsbU (regulator of sigma subunit)